MTLLRTHRQTGHTHTHTHRHKYMRTDKHRAIVHSPSHVLHIKRTVRLPSDRRPGYRGRRHRHRSLSDSDPGTPKGRLFSLCCFSIPASKASPSHLTPRASDPSISCLFATAGGWRLQHPNFDAKPPPGCRFCLRRNVLLPSYCMYMGHHP